MKLADLDLNDKEGKKRSAPKDRVPMIKEVFETVLNREPSSRELSFYKYGIQEREEIIEKLLKDDEHQEALEKAQDAPKLKDQLKDSQHQVKKLNQQIKDMEEETNQVKNLLDEKNKEIAILRREKEDPYNFTHSEALKYIKTLAENKRTEINQTTQRIEGTNTHFTTIASIPNQQKTFLDKVYDFIKSI
jgi:chromosome segregation ATPase